MLPVCVLCLACVRHSKLTKHMKAAQKRKAKLVKVQFVFILILKNGTMHLLPELCTVFALYPHSVARC